MCMPVAVATSGTRIVSVRGAVKGGRGADLATPGREAVCFFHTRVLGFEILADVQESDDQGLEKRTDPAGMLQIHTLSENDRVRAQMLVAEKHLARTKDGKPYLRLGLMNRSGTIEGVLWDDAEAAAEPLSRGEVVAIEAVVVRYQNELRLRLRSVRPVPSAERDLDRLLPVSSRDPAEMEEELHRTVRKVRNPFLRRLLEGVFRDPEIWRAFSRAPAAKALHHAYRGGLLEHTLSLAGLVQQSLKSYPFLDADLVLAGALLHDLGKSRELSADLGFDYTDEGRLLGHILIGVRILEEKIAAIPDFPPELAMHVKHLVTSHHGKMEFGSPRTPASLEALFLHALDNLDAKMWGVHAFLEAEARGGGNWTSFHRVYEQYFFVPEGYRGGEASAEERKEKRGREPPDLFES